MAKKFKEIEEQRRVIDVFGKNAIISASAGSGKTSVLIRKISDYIKNREVDISNILALTYTNAAAGEMKERLSQSLVAVIEKEISSKEKINKLVQQIDKVSTADISTFHSFYERVLKKYFYVLGIDPSFSILSNEENVVLKDTAFKSAIDKLKEEDFEGYIRISDILGKKRKDIAIKERLLKIEEFLSSQLNKKEWLDETALFMMRKKDETYKIMSMYIYEEIDGIISSFEDIVSENLDPQITAYSNNCILKLKELENLNFEQLYSAIGSFRFPSLSAKLEDEKIAEIREVRDTFKGVRDYKKLGDFEIIEKSFISCEKNIEVLLTLYKDYIKILGDKKRKLNKYSFNDLEELCRKVMENEKAREEIKRQYKLIFIDEFQDTNPVQYEIIKKISTGNNLFIVGDPKQSIYAFRQTDVDIFNNVYNEFLSNDAEALLLKKNFRSNKKILQFINNVFDVVMQKDLSGMDYKNSSRFESESENSCEGSSVVISLIEKDSKKTDKEIEGVYDIFSDKPEEEDESLEAQLIVHQIGKVIKEQIFDDETKSKRDVEYGDIAILVKDRSSLLKELVHEFREYNVPYLVNDKVDLLASKEVQLIVSFLKLLKNLKDDISLSSMLCSDFGDLSFDQVASMRSKYPEASFYSCFSSYLNNEKDEISKKLERFYKIFSDFKFNISFKGISLALNLLFAETDALEKIRLKKDGENRVEVLQQFVAFIEQSPFNDDLLGLLNFIENNSSVYVSSVRGSSLDAVKITTIHGSKGLEYPIVFLGDAGKDLFLGKPDTSDLKISKNLGIAIKNYDEDEREIYPSIFEEVIKVEKERKDLAEYLRLLYVALTRAKNKLFISGEIEKSKKISKIRKEIDILKIKPRTFLNFVMGTMSKDILEKLAIMKKYTDDCLSISYINRNNFEFNFKQKEKVGSFDLAQVKKYINSDKNEYKYKSATKLSQKTTVTQLMDSDGYESRTYEPQKFIISEHFKGSVTAEQGTLVHSILERVGFELDEIELEKNIEECIKHYYDDSIEFEFLNNMIRENVKVIKKLIPKKSKVFKEKMFITNASLKDVFGETENEEILIQGKVDLIAIGDKNIIIDYKYTSITNEKRLIEKYRKQLKSYCFAVEQALGVKIDETYILDLKRSRLILVIF